MLKASGTKRLKLNYDRLLSILLQFCFNFAFKFNLRRYGGEDYPFSIAADAGGAMHIFLAS